jgi:hypothetical protein
MSDDDDFFAASKRYQQDRILQGGPPIDDQRLKAIFNKIENAMQQGVDDIREVITLEEWKLVLAAAAEWQRMTMPNIDPGKDTSQ